MSEIKVGKLTGKNDHLFETDHLQADLKGRSVRGGAATMVAQGVKFFLEMASMVVLGRLLTPEDYGLIAMVITVTGFVTMFKDLGLSMATVQKATVNHDQISTLFWINVALSSGIVVITASLAPAIAWFYGEPRLTWITLVMASSFIFGGLTVQHQALLRRQMRFVSLAVIQVISLLISITAAIIAAWFGMGYWALVIMYLAETISFFIAVWVACRWCPGIPVRRSGVREMLAFGGNVTGFNIIHYLFRNLDNILIGKFCGPLSLGLYSKAYKIMMLPLTQIRTPLNMVALPALSSLQKQPIRFSKYYAKLVSFIAFASMPLVAFLAVCSDNIIRLLLGNQWLGASLIFQVLALAAFIQPVTGTRGVVLLSLGQSGRYLKWGVLQSIFTAVSFIIGLRWGAIGVAISFTISNYLLLFPSLWYCFRLTPISTIAFLKAISGSTIASFFMVVVVYFCSLSLVGQPDIIIIVICFASGLFTYFLAWFLIPNGIERLREIHDVFSLVFKRTEKLEEEG